VSHQILNVGGFLFRLSNEPPVGGDLCVCLLRDGRTIAAIFDRPADDALCLVPLFDAKRARLVRREETLALYVVRTKCLAPGPWRVVCRQLRAKPLMRPASVIDSLPCLQMRSTC
jgi:hypothetical protein